MNNREIISQMQPKFFGQEVEEMNLEVVEYCSGNRRYFENIQQLFKTEVLSEEGSESQYSSVSSLDHTSKKQDKQAAQFRKLKKADPHSDHYSLQLVHVRDWE